MNQFRQSVRCWNVLKLPRPMIATRLYAAKSGQLVRTAQKRYRGSYRIPATVAIGLISSAFLFGFMDKPNTDDPDETLEDKLIQTIKGALACIKKTQYEKAEIMLNAGMRMAKKLKNLEGIAYIYNVMANLAMERRQFKKAERLFVDIMKQLVNDGCAEDCSQILHIRAKMAHMAQLQGDLERAGEGFVAALQKIEERIKNFPGDPDIREILGFTKDWFGQLLMKQGKYTEAKKCFEEAYSVLVEIYGNVTEEAVTILNNLSVACVNLEDFELAKKHLKQALTLVQELKESNHEGVLHANLGLIYLREGMLAEAKETCNLAWRVAKESHNVEAVEQAEYCLNEIKSYTPYAQDGTP